MEFLAIFVEPVLFGVVVGVDVDDLGVPVRLLAGDEVATLEDENAFPGRCQVIGKRPTAGASANDDYVIAIVVHDANPPFAPQKMQRFSLSWWSLQHFTPCLPFRHR